MNKLIKVILVQVLLWQVWLLCLSDVPHVVILFVDPYSTIKAEKWVQSSLTHSVNSCRSVCASDSRWYLLIGLHCHLLLKCYLCLKRNRFSPVLYIYTVFTHWAVSCRLKETKQKVEEQLGRMTSVEHSVMELWTCLSAKPALCFAEFYPWCQKSHMLSFCVCEKNKTIKVFP